MRGGITPHFQREREMSELKLEKRKLSVDVYGEKENLLFPSVRQQKAYLEELLKEGADEIALTSKYFTDLGMSEKSIESLELPHMYEVLEVISGQKKI